MWLNVGCGSFRAPPPWLNLDCHDGDGVHPDEVVDPDRPLATYPDNRVDRVYMGHVLEHIPWPDVPAFLADIHRALRPGGEICVVGPDILRVLKRWKEDLDPEGWDLIESILENPWDRCYGETGYGLIYEEPRWKHSRHWWNCYEARVVFLFRQHTEFVDVEPQPIHPEQLGSWPLVAYTLHQCAVTARKAGG